MIDVVTVGAGGGSIAWISPEGTLKVGPQSAGADPGPLCYGQRRHRRHGHRRAPRARPDPAAPARRRDRRWTSRRPAPALDALADRLGLSRGRCADRHPRDLGLEPGQRAAPGHRQARPGRARLHPHHVRRFRFAAGLPADRHPRPAGGAGAAEPGQRVGVRAAHRRRQATTTCRPAVRQRATTSIRRRPSGSSPSCSAQADEALAREGFAPASSSFVRTADLRYFGQAFEVRVPVPDGAARRRPRSRGGDRVPRRAPRAVRLRLPRRRRPAGRVGEPAGHRASARSGGPSCASCAARDGAAAEPGTRPVCFDAPATTSRPPIYQRADLAAGDVDHRPGDHRGVRLDRAVHPGFAARVDRFGNLLIDADDA